MSSQNSRPTSLTFGKVGNFIGNVFSKAIPFVQGTGKVFGEALMAFDFFYQLDSGENAVNATLEAGGELVNSVKSFGKAIGDGVSGFFGGLGNVFGF